MQQEIKNYADVVQQLEQKQTRLKKDNDLLLEEIQQLHAKCEEQVNDAKNTIWLAARALTDDTANAIIDDVRKKNEFLEAELANSKTTGEQLKGYIEQLEQDLSEKKKTIDEKAAKIAELEALLKQQKKPDDDSFDGSGNSNSDILGGYGSTPY